MAYRPLRRLYRSPKEFPALKSKVRSFRIRSLLELLKVKPGLVKLGTIERDKRVTLTPLAKKAFSADSLDYEEVVRVVTDAHYHLRKGGSSCRIWRSGPGWRKTKGNIIVQIGLVDTNLPLSRTSKA